MAIGKCTAVFSGIFLVCGITWEDLSMEEIFIGEETFSEGGAGFFSII